MATSKELRAIAEELRKSSKDVDTSKSVKCAKYIVGMTALKLLEDKLKRR